MTRGEKLERENSVFSENFHRKNPYRMLVVDNVKLVVHAATGEVTHLYDLKNDPHELQNLVEDPAWREKRETLRQRLNAFYADIVSRRNPNAIWDPSYETQNSKPETRSAQ